MAHSDDDGLVLPPAIAPQQIVIIPVTPKEDTRDAIIDSCQALAETLRGIKYRGQALRVKVDTSDRGGKKWEGIKKGVPLRIEIGPRDLENRKVCVQRRDQAANEKQFIDREDFIRQAEETLGEVHKSLLERATSFRDDNISTSSSLADFEKHWENDQAGWLLTPWAGTREEEGALSKKHKITIRCLPLDQQEEAEEPCVLTGQPTKSRALWGRSY